jgi:hypothetical protein
MKCNKTIGKWCKNKHGASKIIDTFETYHLLAGTPTGTSISCNLKETSNCDQQPEEPQLSAQAK